MKAKTISKSEVVDLISNDLNFKTCIVCNDTSRLKRFLTYNNYIDDMQYVFKVMSFAKKTLENR